MTPTHATLVSAISFAAHKHRAQRRKDAEPGAVVDARPVVNRRMLKASCAAGDARP
jgi:hypothetical protein